MKLGAPDASGRRRPEPAPGTEFTIECDRVLLAIGQGPDLTWIGAGSDGVDGDQEPAPAGRCRHVRSRLVPASSGPATSASGAQTVVQADRRGAPRVVRRGRLPQGAWTSGRSGPARRWPSRSRSSSVDRAVHRRGEGAALPARDHAGRGAQRQLRRVRDPVHAAARPWPNPTRCLQCTCEAIGFCDLRRLGIEYGTTLRTLEPQNNQGAGFRSVTENRFTGTNHDYIRDDSHAFILREPSRCIDCGRCANVCAEVVGAACYDFMRIGFDTLVTTPLDMSLNDTPCVSCGRCAETCPTGALMPKPRDPREVRRGREPLHPVRHLRRRLPVRRAALRAGLRARPRQPRGADDRPHRDRRGRPRDGDDLRASRARLAGAGDRFRPGRRAAAASRAPAVARRAPRRERHRPTSDTHNGHNGHGPAGGGVAGHGRNR